MPNTLKQHHVEPNPDIHAAIPLTLTNTIFHPGDPTWQIESTLTIYRRTIASEPEIEVSLTHA